MLLANVKVGSDIKKQSYVPHKKTGTSLKNLSSIRTEISKQERIKKKLNKASGESKEARKSIQLSLEIKKAFDKLRGVKVHDNLKLLKKAEKRLVSKKKKSADAWAARKDHVKESQAERQTKRKDNIEKFRGNTKKKMAKAEPEKADVSTGSKKQPGMSRKQRRHSNLMKFGPKKTREEREDKRKKDRKDRRKTPTAGSRPAKKSIDKKKGGGKKFTKK